MTTENLIIYTYNKGLATPEALREDLDCRRIGSSAANAARAIPANALVVNWGYGRVPDWAAGRRVRYLNHPTNVARKMSKIYQLHQFREAGVPTFDVTTSANDVRRWLNDGHRVLCRQDEGARGTGITVVESLGRDGKVPVADFYTRWFDKTHEFRFHVFAPLRVHREVGQGEAQRGLPPGIIDIVQKKRLYAAKPFNQLTLTEQTVRNHANGWIEAHKDLHLPGDSRERLAAACVDAVRCLGLDFGGVDIVARFNGRTLVEMAVCEVNTAPGLGAVERDAYVTAIKGVYDEMHA